MVATSMKVPSFHHNQRVSFVGGHGIVRNFKSESGNWTYLVEMELGMEPAFGRVGSETMVIFDEADLMVCRKIPSCEPYRELVEDRLDDLYLE